MNDEEELLAKVRIALETSGGVSDRCLAAVKAEAMDLAASRRCWACWRKVGVGLLAASLLATFCWRVHFHDMESSESDLISAIELLSAVDGRKIEGENAAELLLAWQDAPYSAICASFTVD